jgi:flagellar basal-body rod modification protein FlgD
MVDYSAINAAAQTGSTGGASINSRQDASRASLADSEQTFLALMTTQLKNQDPLSPVDSNQFTQQIVQMTGVEQQLLTNDLLKVLVGMNDGGLSGQVSMIGKEVTTQSATGTLKDKALNFDYDLSKAAGTLKLEVVDASGKTVATVTPTDLTKGAHTFKWDGKNTAGEQQPDGGVYSLKITATDSLGSKLDATATAANRGIVTAVSLENGVQMVTVNGQKIAASDIISVAAVAEAANNNTTPDPNTAADPKTDTETPADAA